MNPKTTIEWLDRAKHPALSGKRLLFLYQEDPLAQKYLCWGTVEYDAAGVAAWHDETACADNAPSPYPDSGVTYWALMPMFDF